MNWLDIVITILLVIDLLVGLRTGLVRTVISFAGLILENIWPAGTITLLLDD